MLEPQVQELVARMFVVVDVEAEEVPAQMIATVRLVSRK